MDPMDTVKKLEANIFKKVGCPSGTTLSVEAQERQERREESNAGVKAFMINNHSRTKGKYRASKKYSS